MWDGEGRESCECGAMGAYRTDGAMVGYGTFVLARCALYMMQSLPNQTFLSRNPAPHPLRQGEEASRAEARLKQRQRLAAAKAAAGQWERATVVEHGGAGLANVLWTASHSFKSSSCGTATASCKLVPLPSVSCARALNCSRLLPRRWVLVGRNVLSLSLYPTVHD